MDTHAARLHCKDVIKTGPCTKFSSMALRMFVYTALVSEKLVYFFFQDKLFFYREWSARNCPYFSVHISVMIRYLVVKNCLNKSVVGTRDLNSLPQCCF